MQEYSEKKYTTAVILAGIFGVLGIHHFYIGRWGMGIFDLGLSIAAFFFFYIQDQHILGIFLFGVDVIHTIIVTYLLLIGKFKDGSGKYIPYPGQKRHNQ